MHPGCVSSGKAGSEPGQGTAPRLGHPMPGGKASPCHPTSTKSQRDLSRPQFLGGALAGGPTW